MADIPFVFCQILYRKLCAKHREIRLSSVRGMKIILVKRSFFNNLTFPEKKIVFVFHKNSVKVQKIWRKILRETSEMRVITARKIVHKMLKT